MFDSKSFRDDFVSNKAQEQVSKWWLQENKAH